MSKKVEKIVKIGATLDRKPILSYEGRSIQIKSEGTSSTTHIFVDGKEIKGCQELTVHIKNVPKVDEAVLVEMILFDVA